MRRFRFRLVTLLAAMTVCCIVLGLGVTVGRRVHAQRQFMTYVSERYGNTNKPSIRVYYDYENEADGPYSGDPYPRPLLTDVLHQIDRVRFGGLDLADDPDEDAAVLSTISSLTVVEIQGISNLGAAYLSRLKKLQSLTINDSDITDRGLFDLSKLPNLKWLDIRNASNRLTIEAVARFRKQRHDVELLEDAWWTEEAESRAKEIESGAYLNKRATD